MCKADNHEESIMVFSAIRHHVKQMDQVMAINHAGIPSPARAFQGYCRHQARGCSRLRSKVCRALVAVRPIVKRDRNRAEHLET